MARLFLLASLMACSLQPSPIVLLGDSITKGERPGVYPTQTFGARLEPQLGTEIKNLGFSGETTEQGLKRIGQVIALHPRTVVIMYGTNDSYIETDTPRIPIEQFRANFHAMVILLKRAGIRPILMTPPAWEDQQKNISLASYVQAVREIAQETETPLVDNFSYWAFTKHPQWTTDNCHPNPTGHLEIARLLYPVLLENQ